MSDFIALAAIELIAARVPRQPDTFFNFFSSRTWIAPADGVCVIRGLGAGGGGPMGVSGATNAMGGGSGAWGIKVVPVKKGDVVTVTIGAGGAIGAAGGNTTITINGETYIATGGVPGVINSASDPYPTGGAQPSANWDMGVAGATPLWGASVFRGGAGVDILAQGPNALISPNNGDGGSTGASLSKGYDEWSVDFYADGIGGAVGTSGSSSVAGGKGGTGGPGGGGGAGGGSVSGAPGTGGQGGLGAGGGAGGKQAAGGAVGNGDKGGSGYAHLKFYFKGV